MRYLVALIGLLCVCILSWRSADARVDIHVNLAAQSMTVTSASGAEYEWPVSTARRGYTTPRGVFRPQRLVLVAYSRKYENSPMPHSIFFTGGYAIHGTYEVAHLGRPVSHGCIRLSPANAATLYALVKAEGARITITGSPPSSTPIARSGRRRAGPAFAARRLWRQSPADDFALPSDPYATRMWLLDPLGSY